MFLGGVVAQYFTGSLTIDRYICLANLTVEFIGIPMRINRPRNKSLGPLHPLEICFLHDFAGASNRSSGATTGRGFGTVPGLRLAALWSVRASCLNAAKVCDPGLQTVVPAW